MTAFSETCRFLFFSADLRFESQQFSSEDPRSVAVHALLGRGDPARPSAIRCAWDADARLQRARTLLAPARSGNQSADAWEAFETEWRWVSTSAYVRKVVAGAATDAAAAAVLAGVVDELLPLLRLRAAILAHGNGKRAEAAMHLQALATWSLPEQSAVSFARAYAVYLRTLTATGQPLTPAISHNVVKILSRTSDDEVAEEFAALASQSSDAEFLAGQLEYVVQHARPRIDLRRLYASVEVAAAVKKINDGLGASEGVARLARARVLDPWSGNAAERLSEAVELRNNYAEALSSQTAELTPAAKVALRHYLDSFDAALRGAEGFDGTDEANKLRMQWNDALARGAARGLGWSEDPESLRRALVVIDAIDDAFGNAEQPTQQIFERAWALARARGIEPRDVPWNDIAEAFTKKQITFGAALAFVFRQPGAGPVIEESVAADAAGTPVTGRPPSPTMVWLFSPRHWLLKAAAVAGLLMLLHAGAGSAAASMHRQRVQRQYDAFVTATQNTDRAEAIRSGPALLESLDTADPRMREVARLYRDTVFREVVDRGARGDAAGAQQLLQHYESVTGAPVVRASLVD